MSETESVPTRDDAIDAVVTWVDGNDPRHVERKRAALHELGRRTSDVIPAGIDMTRFSDNNEIEYCIRSIRKFAPWIRTIHLITDAQCPAFLTPDEMRRLGVTLVDHRDIFSGFDDALPTFNSLSIETVLHRTPGLAERFLYFNDDFILAQPVRPNDFFRGESVVLRGAWHRLPAFGPIRLALSAFFNKIAKKLLGINRAMSVLQQIRAAQLVGMQHRYFKVAHTPYPLRRRTVEQFWARNPDAFADNVRHRFRSLSQVATTGVANHLEILAETADLIECDDAEMICFNRDRASAIHRKLGELAAGRFRFFCVQSLEQARPQHRERLQGILDWIVKS